MLGAREDVVEDVGAPDACDGQCGPRRGEIEGDAAPADTDVGNDDGRGARGESGLVEFEDEAEDLVGERVDGHRRNLNRGSRPRLLMSQGQTSLDLRHRGLRTTGLSGTVTVDGKHADNVSNPERTIRWRANIGCS